MVHSFQIFFCSGHVCDYNHALSCSSSSFFQFFDLSPPSHFNLSLWLSAVLAEVAPLCPLSPRRKQEVSKRSQTGSTNNKLNTERKEHHPFCKLFVSEEGKPESRSVVNVISLASSKNYTVIIDFFKSVFWKVKVVKYASFSKKNRNFQILYMDLSLTCCDDEIGQHQLGL